MDSKKKLKERLKLKFPPKDVEWVIIRAGDYQGRNGRVIKAYAQPYIKKESAELRADEIFGPLNWENDFEMPDQYGRIKYMIRFRKDERSSWLYRYDGASIDLDAKGNFKSDDFEIALTFAEKRCWAKVGIGRYLKLIPMIQVEVSETYKEGWNYYAFKSSFEKVKKGNKTYPKRVKFYWREPHLPDWALPEGFEYPDKPQTEDPDPPKKLTNEQRTVATGKLWEDIEAYYKAISEDDKELWFDYLYQSEVDDETGEVVGQHRRRISVATARKILNSMRKGYGTLNKDRVPEKIAQQQLQKENQGTAKKKTPSRQTE